MFLQTLITSLVILFTIFPNALIAEDISPPVENKKKNGIAINKVELKSINDKTSYYFGMTMGDSLRETFTKVKVSFDVDQLIKGIQDSMRGRVKTKETQEAMKKQITEYINGNKKVSKEKVSYYYGVDMIQTTLKRGTWKGLDINLDLLIIAFKRAYGGDQPLQSEQEGFKALVALTQKEIVKQPLMKVILFGNAYLTKNATKKGVMVTKSGLQYEIIKKGKGASPNMTDVVFAHYNGKLINGTIIHSSLKQKKPIALPMTGVIKGWAEALQLMKVGSKWRITIPPELGYGKSGSGATIPANAVLIFEIELLGIQKKKK